MATDPNDLEELLRRRALTEDAARPDAVQRRHASGGRTARENVDDLIDPGSWVEYLGKDVLEHGEEHNGVDPKYRPRGYNEGPKE